MKLSNIYITGIGLACSLFIVTGCEKIVGLPRQQNVDHIVSTLDPHIDMTALDYLKSRALGTSDFKDSILYRMYQAVEYSGIDINEYSKAGRTYIFLHNDAILRKTGTTTTTDSYFGRYKVNGLAATKWEDYPKAQVKNYLLSLIVEGEQSFETVSAAVTYTKSLMPLAADTLNPESVITFSIVNDIDSKMRLNNFPGSALTSGITVRTAGILSTNGPIHVIDRVLYYQKL